MGLTQRTHTNAGPPLAISNEHGTYKKYGAALLASYLMGTTKLCRWKNSVVFEKLQRLAVSFLHLSPLRNLRAQLFTSILLLMFLDLIPPSVLDFASLESLVTISEFSEHCRREIQEAVKPLSDSIKVPPIKSAIRLF